MDYTTLTTDKQHEVLDTQIQQTEGLHFQTKLQLAKLESQLSLLTMEKNNLPPESSDYKPPEMNLRAARPDRMSR